MQTKLIADTIGELTFSWQLPPFLAAYILPGHVPTVATASFGHVIWQEIPCNGITIRMQHYLLNQGCHFTCIEENPMLKLQLQVTNHVQVHLDRLGHYTFYEHGYNLVYMSHPKSQLHFPAEGIYSYLEIFYPENNLLKLQSSFPLMSQFLKRVQRQQPAMLMPVNQIGTRSLLDLINRLQVVMQRTIDKTYLRTRTVEILAQCLDDMSRHPQLQPVTLPLEDATGIYHVRNLLMEQYEQNWTMKKLSEKTGLNFYKLEMGFQQLYGTSPADYLRDVRMEKAWQLLPGKKYSVAQVAEMVGYTNLSAFSKAFKKYHHITARQRSKE